MLQLGSVVCAVAGRDKPGFFAVVSLEPLLIADGKARKLAAAKRKNPLHLRPTKTVLEASAFATDKQLRLALAPFNEREGRKLV